MKKGKTRINEVYNPTEDDLDRYMSKVNNKQMNFGLDDYSELYDFDEEIITKAKHFGIPTSKSDRFSKSLGRPDASIKPLQSDITDSIRRRAKSSVVNLRELAPRNAKGDDINPSVDYLSDKDKKFIQRVITTKGYAAIGPDDIDLSCRGDVFTYGNSKLPYWTMIFNMTSAKNCPSTECALKDICYAWQGNNFHKETLYRDLRNQAMLRHISAKELLRLVYAYIETAKVRVRHIRLSEAGDFTDQSQVDMAERFAKILWHRYRVKVVAYSARALDFSNCKYLIVNGSNTQVKGATRYYFCRWKDYLDRFGIDTESGGIQKYTDSKGVERNAFFCKCNCYKCNFCYNSIEENGEDPENPTRVFVLPHGPHVRKDGYRSKGSHATKKKKTSGKAKKSGARRATGTGAETVTESFGRGSRDKDKLRDRIDKSYQYGWDDMIGDIEELAERNGFKIENGDDFGVKYNYENYHARYFSKRDSDFNLEINITQWGSFIPNSATDLMAVSATFRNTGAPDFRKTAEMRTLYLSTNGKNVFSACVKDYVDAIDPRVDNLCSAVTAERFTRAILEKCVSGDKDYDSLVDAVIDRDQNTALIKWRELLGSIGYTDVALEEMEKLKTNRPAAREGFVDLLLPSGTLWAAKNNEAKDSTDTTPAYSLDDISYIIEKLPTFGEVEELFRCCVVKVCKTTGGAPYLNFRSALDPTREINIGLRIAAKLWFRNDTFKGTETPLLPIQADGEVKVMSVDTSYTKKMKTVTTNNPDARFGIREVIHGNSPAARTEPLTEGKSIDSDTKMKNLIDKLDMMLTDAVESSPIEGLTKSVFRMTDSSQAMLCVTRSSAEGDSSVKIMMYVCEAVDHKGVDLLIRYTDSKAAELRYRYPLYYLIKGDSLAKKTNGTIGCGELLGWANTYDYVGRTVREILSSIERGDQAFDKLGEFIDHGTREQLECDMDDWLGSLGFKIEEVPLTESFGRGSRGKKATDVTDSVKLGDFMFTGEALDTVSSIVDGREDVKIDVVGGSWWEGGTVEITRSYRNICLFIDIFQETDRISELSIWMEIDKERYPRGSLEIGRSGTTYRNGVPPELAGLSADSVEDFKQTPNDVFRILSLLLDEDDWKEFCERCITRLKIREADKVRCLEEWLRGKGFKTPYLEAQEMLEENDRLVPEGYMNLMLPSGNIWATKNIGASGELSQGPLMNIDEIDDSMLPTLDDFKELVKYTDVMQYVEKSPTGNSVDCCGFRGLLDPNRKIILPCLSVYNNTNNAFYAALHKGKKVVAHIRREKNDIVVRRSLKGKLCCVRTMIRRNDAVRLTESFGRGTRGKKGLGDQDKTLMPTLSDGEKLANYLKGIADDCGVNVRMMKTGYLPFEKDMLFYTNDPERLSLKVRVEWEGCGSENRRLLHILIDTGKSYRSQAYLYTGNRYGWCKDIDISHWAHRPVRFDDEEELTAAIAMLTRLIPALGSTAVRIDGSERNVAALGKKVGMILQEADCPFLEDRLQRELKDRAPAPEGYIDMGLPSGTLWAECNVGAEQPYECGSYEQSGDYQDTLPTTEQIVELNRFCNKSVVVVSGVRCIKFISKVKRSLKLLMPIAGHKVYIKRLGDDAPDYFLESSYGYYPATRKGASDFENLMTLMSDGEVITTTSRLGWHVKPTLYTIRQVINR